MGWSGRFSSSVRRARFALGAPLAFAGAVAAFAPVAAADRSSAPAAKPRGTSYFAGDVVARRQGTTVRAEFSVPNYRCHHYPERATFVGVRIVAQPASAFASSIIALGCDHGRKGTNQDLALGNTGHVILPGPNIGDRVVVTSSVGPGHRSRATYADVTTHSTKRLTGRTRGRPSEVQIGDSESLFGFPAGPPPVFDELTFRNVRINGTPIAVFHPKRRNLLVNGHVRIRTGRLRHRDSFTTRLVH